MERLPSPFAAFQGTLLENETRSPPRGLRVLIVDDHPVVRDGLRAMLEASPGLEVVGTASDGEEALEQAHRLRPDVVLMDIRMPGINGIEATQRIKAAYPQTAVIILTMYDSEMYLLEALRSGAAGYLVKDCSRELLCYAISAAAEGGTMVRSSQPMKGMPGLRPGDKKGPQEAKDLGGREQLTGREREVLRLVAQGRANKEIARELSLAEVTVKKYVQSLMGKLGAANRTGAAILALRLGLAE